MRVVISNQNVGQGVFRKVCDIQGGETYSLTLDWGLNMEALVGTFYIKIAKGLIHSPSPDLNCLETTPPDSPFEQTIFTATSSVDVPLHTEEICFTPDKSFNQIWFYFKSTTFSTQGGTDIADVAFFDNIILKKCSGSPLSLNMASHSPETPCAPDETATLQWELCYTDCAEEVGDISYTLDFPQGINILGNSPISSTISMDPGECITLSWEVEAWAGYGTYDFSLDVSGQECCQDLQQDTYYHTITFDCGGPDPTFSTDLTEQQCDAMRICLFSQGNPQTIISHYWDFGDGSTSTEASPCHFYYQSGTYLVAHTVWDTDDNINTSVQEVEVQVDPPVYDLSVGSPGATTYLSDLVVQYPNIFGPSGMNNVNVFISGDLVMNSGNIEPGLNYVISNCHFWMDAGAKIILPVAATAAEESELTIKETHIEGCTKRWYGIWIDSHAAPLHIIGSPEKPCIIEDAQYAVHPHISIIEIKRTWFRNNYIGLYYEDDGEPGSHMFMAPFYGNIFEGQSFLLPHFDNTDVNNGPWAFAGIYTVGQEWLHIGTTEPASPYNQFKKLRNGIITEDCELSITKTNFKQIHDLDYDLAGYAIFAKGSGQHFSQNPSASSTMYFEDCAKGIYLEDMHAKILNNQMTGVRVGIHVAQSANRNIRIKDNTLNVSEVGILLWQNAPTTQTFVLNNTILLEANDQSLKPTAILVQENGTPQPDALISLNEISTVNAGAGIALQNANGYVVKENLIAGLQSPYNSPPYKGISLQNSPNNFISCNSISSNWTENNSTGFSSQGIAAKASPYNLYECNEISNTYIGVQFDMNCMDSELKGTSLSNHHYGLHYKATGLTGEQPSSPQNPLHGNRWNGSWGSPERIGAKHESVDQNYVNQSRYYVPDIAVPEGPENPESVSQDWFKKKENWFEYSCQFACPQEMLLSFDAQSIDQKIARGQLDPGTYSSETQWMLQRHLYGKLYKNPSLQQNSPVLDSFYLAQAGSAMAKLTEIETNIFDLFVLDTTTQLMLDSYDAQIQEKTDSISWVDSLLLENISPADSLLLTDLRWQLAEELVALSTSNDALIDSLLQIRYQEADILRMQNASIATYNTLESNEKEFNELFLSSLAQGQVIDSSQFASLYDLASLCPYENGTAIFKARSLLQSAFSDEYLCGEQLLQKPYNNETMNEIQTKTLLHFSVYPNPAHDRIHLTFQAKTKSDLSVTLLNIYGTICANWTLAKGEQTVEYALPSLPSGVYQVVVNSKSGETKRRLITIQ